MRYLPAQPGVRGGVALHRRRHRVPTHDASARVRYFEERGLDHLTAIPDVQVPVWRSAPSLPRSPFFSRFIRGRGRPATPELVPYRHRSVQLDSHTAYRAVGTHRRIAMRPDDDLKLGKLVKKHGLRQDVLYARDLIAVEWYRSIGEMIDGLMKNTFAGVNYSLWGAAGSTLALCLIIVWPFAGFSSCQAGYTRCLTASARCWSVASSGRARDSTVAGCGRSSRFLLPRCSSRT